MAWRFSAAVTAGDAASNAGATFSGAPEHFRRRVLAVLLPLHNGLKCRIRPPSPGVSVDAAPAAADVMRKLCRGRLGPLCLLGETQQSQSRCNDAKRLPELRPFLSGIGESDGR